jgi:hypothetical protein
MLDPYTSKRRTDSSMFLAILLMIALAGLVNWLIMLLFGVVHSFWEFVPAFGFWQTLVIWTLVSLLSSTSFASRS